MSSEVVLPTDISLLLSLLLCFSVYLSSTIVLLPPGMTLVISFSSYLVATLSDRLYNIF